ncbi:MAG TPA: hypothetical protein VK986_22850, partial [Tepidisphaeraceae bacterium]|nr:hypothetical protein [Tepidisphaeraceae bacterium]
GLHKVLIAGPRWVLTRPAVLAFFKSRAMRAVGRYTVKPALVAGLVWLFVPDTTPAASQWLVVGLAFLGVNLVLNTPAGRLFEREMLHTLRTTVARRGWEILVALGRAIMALFQSLLEGVDRFLYAVDERLRFRPGQSRAMVVLKAAVGVVWFYVAYFTRLIINLLVEPQINPIKHFPVVTVSHKLLLPTIPFVADVLGKFGVERVRALAMGGAIVTSIPGIFGFLAWEFRANWKLYHANRPRMLGPVKVGSHGETMAGFLCPGFHSGTLPKAYARLRKLAARGDTDPESSAKAHRAIEHAEHALHALVERELLALVNRHPLFASGPLGLASLRLSTTQVRATIAKGEVHGHDSHAANGSGPSHGSHSAPSSAPACSEAMTIVFEQRSGWVMASIAADALTPSLNPSQRDLLSAALLGFYKLSAVDLIAEQVGAVVNVPGAPVDVRRRWDLIVWPTPDSSAPPAVYCLTGEGALRPTNGVPLPTLPREAVLYRSATVTRAAWDALWTGAPNAGAFPKFRVLPGA